MNKENIIPLKTILLVILLLAGFKSKAQYGFGTNTPNPNSVMHLYSQDSAKGLVIPIVTTVKRPLAASSLQGMLVYNTTDNCIQFCNGTKWVCLDSVGSNIGITIDSVSYHNDSLYIYENNKEFKTRIVTPTDTSLIDSLILAKKDTLYSFISDSLLKDSLWIDSLYKIMTSSNPTTDMPWYRNQSAPKSISSAGADINLDYPSTVLPNDLLIVVVTGQSITAPAGWNILASQSSGLIKYTVIYKIATGLETGTMFLSNPGSNVVLNPFGAIMYNFAKCRISGVPIEGVITTPYDYADTTITDNPNNIIGDNRLGVCISLMDFDPSQYFTFNGWGLISNTSGLTNSGVEEYNLLTFPMPTIGTNSPELLIIYGIGLGRTSTINFYLRPIE